MRSCGRASPTPIATTRRHLRILALLLALASVARAEPGKNDDPIAARLFPSELIMKHQRELAIDDKHQSEQQPRHAAALWIPSGQSAA